MSTKVDPLDFFPIFYNMQSVSSNAVAKAYGNGWYYSPPDIPVSSTYDITLTTDNAGTGLIEILADYGTDQPQLYILKMASSPLLSRIDNQGGTSFIQLVSGSLLNARIRTNQGWVRFTIRPFSGNCLSVNVTRVS